MIEDVNILTGAKAADAQAAELIATVSSRVALARKASGLTYDQLAAASGVSKSMLVQIEQARANPSIATLCRLAIGLKVSVAQLVEAGDEPGGPVRIVLPEQSRQLWTGPLGGSARLEVGSHGPDMLELWRWEIHPGEAFIAQPHRPGTREIVRVTSGALRLVVDGKAFLLAAGSAAVARTDRPHSYGAAAEEPVTFTMVVHEPATFPVST